MRDWIDSSLAERIEYALDLRTLSLGDLERITGKSKGTFSRLKSGERKQGEPATLRLLADAARVNYEWLATGHGQPVSDETIDTDALPINLRMLVESSPPGTYSADEVKQAAIYRDLKGRDLTQELWHEYLLSLRREARRMEHEFAALRVVTDDPVERRKARAAAAKKNGAAK